MSAGTDGIYQQITISRILHRNIHGTPHYNHLAKTVYLMEGRADGEGQEQLKNGNDNRRQKRQEGIKMGGAERRLTEEQRARIRGDVVILRDVDGRIIGELRSQRDDDHDDAVGRAIAGEGKFASKTNGKGGTGGQGGISLIALLPAIGLAIITPIGAVVLFPALLGSSSVSLSSKIQLIVVASAAIATAALAGTLSEERPLRFGKVIPDMITASWLVGTVLNAVLSVMLEPELLGFLDWLLLLLFGSFVCLGWAAAAPLIAFVVLKIFLSKA